MILLRLNIDILMDAVWIQSVLNYVKRQIEEISNEGSNIQQVAERFITFHSSILYKQWWMRVITYLKWQPLQLFKIKPDVKF